MTPENIWDFILKNPGLFTEEEYNFALERAALRWDRKPATKWPIRKTIYLHRDDESNFDTFEKYYTKGNFSELEIRSLGMEVEVVVDAYQDGTYKIISIGDI